MAPILFSLVVFEMGSPFRPGLAWALTLLFVCPAGTHCLRQLHLSFFSTEIGPHKLFLSGTAILTISTSPVAGMISMYHYCTSLVVEIGSHDLLPRAGFEPFQAAKITGMSYQH
jgi:hypothetical protein